MMAKQNTFFALGFLWGCLKGVQAYWRTDSAEVAILSFAGALIVGMLVAYLIGWLWSKFSKNKAHIYKVANWFLIIGIAVNILLQTLLHLVPGD